MATAEESTPDKEKTEIHYPLKVETAFGLWAIADQDDRVIAISCKRWYAEILAHDYNRNKERELEWFKGIEAKLENDGG